MALIPVIDPVVNFTGVPRTTADGSLQTPIVSIGTFADVDEIPAAALHSFCIYHSHSRLWQLWGTTTGLAFDDTHDPWLDVDVSEPLDYIRFISVYRTKRLTYNQGFTFLGITSTLLAEASHIQNLAGICAARLVNPWRVWEMKVMMASEERDSTAGVLRCFSDILFQFGASTVFFLFSVTDENSTELRRAAQMAGFSLPALDTGSYVRCSRRKPD